MMNRLFTGFIHLFQKNGSGLKKAKAGNTDGSVYLNLYERMEMRDIDRFAGNRKQSGKPLLFKLINF